MRRLLRRTFNFAAAVAVVLFVGVGVLCIRQRERIDGVTYRSRSQAWIACVRPLGLYLAHGDSGSLGPGWSFDHETKEMSEDDFSFSGEARVWGVFAGVFDADQAATIRYVILPYWLLLMASASTPVLWLMCRLWPRLRRRTAGLCASCGYDMRATPNCCPECGTVPPAGGECGTEMPTGTQLSKTPKRGDAETGTRSEANG